MAASAPVVNPHNVGIVHIMALPVMEFQLRGLQNVVQKYKVSIYSLISNLKRMIVSRHNLGSFLVNTLSKNLLIRKL